MTETFRTLAMLKDGRPVRQSRKPKIVHNDDLTSISWRGKLPHEQSHGHKPHRGGAGTHENKNDKRCRTRGNQIKRAIEDAS